MIALWDQLMTLPLGLLIAACFVAFLLLAGLCGLIGDAIGRYVTREPTPQERLIERIRAMPADERADYQRWADRNGIRIEP